MDLVKFIAGIYYSLLPKSWWRGWNCASTADFSRSGLVSGLLETVFFGWLTWGRFSQNMIERSKLVGGVEMNAGTQLWAFGIFLIDFLVQPVSLIVIYFTLEGAARAYTAFLHDVVLATLPLSLLAKWQQRHTRTEQEKALGPRVRDVVETTPDGLRVASCRPKDWTGSTTISYHDEMWELAKSGEAVGARRFVYSLRKRNSNVAIRALREYDPEEVLR